jgi:hypothetical protein
MPREPTKDEFIRELMMIGEAVDAEAQVLEKRIIELLEGSLAPTNAMVLAALMALASVSGRMLGMLEQEDLPGGLGQVERGFRKQVRAALMRYRGNRGGENGKDKDRVGD